MKPKLTLKQIAKELDVSISTVSKALHGSLEISDETKEKIQAFAKYYNYKPNNIALSLKNRKTRTIGIVIPEIVHHFFATVIRGAENVANERGYNMIICLSNNSFDREVVNMELLANGSIDGFILSIAKETQQKQDYHHIQEVISRGMPLVLFDRVTDKVNCDKVIIDDVEGAKRAVLHLAALGCKHIGLVSTVDYISVGKLRTQGYKTALQQAGLPIDDNLILKIEDIENSQQQIVDFIKKNKLDAVFAVNEQFAASAIKGLNEKGMKVPDEISVIAFTNGEISQNFVPSLTTVSQHGADMGAMAANMLIDRLENPTESEAPFATQIIRTSLIERDSTRRML